MSPCRILGTLVLMSQSLANAICRSGLLFRLYYHALPAK